MIEHFSFPAFQSADLDLFSGLKSSLKLQKLGISEIIIQAGIRDLNQDQPVITDDGTLPKEVTLAQKLLDEKIVANKFFVFVNNGRHNCIQQWGKTSAEVLLRYPNYFFGKEEERRTLLKN